MIANLAIDLVNAYDEYAPVAMNNNIKSEVSFQVLIHLLYFCVSILNSKFLFVTSWAYYA